MLTSNKAMSLYLFSSQWLDHTLQFFQSNGKICNGIGTNNQLPVPLQHKYILQIAHELRSRSNESENLESHFNQGRFFLKFVNFTANFNLLFLIKAD